MHTWSTCCPSTLNKRDFDCLCHVLSFLFSSNSSIVLFDPRLPFLWIFMFSIHRVPDNLVVHQSHSVRPTLRLVCLPERPLSLASDTFRYLPLERKSRETDTGRKASRATLMEIPQPPPPPNQQPPIPSSHHSQSKLTVSPYPSHPPINTSAQR